MTYIVWFLISLSIIQVGQLSLPSSPRLVDPAIKLMQQQQQTAAEAAAATASAAVGAGAAAGAVTTDRVGRANNPKLRGANESGSDEDQVPTRGFLKRQTRIIVDAKTKKQNQRPRKNDWKTGIWDKIIGVCFFNQMTANLIVESKVE